MSLFLITGSTLLGAVLLLIIMKPKKLHVEVEPMKMKVMGINIWPLLVTMNNLMPEGMRKNSVTKQVKLTMLLTIQLVSNEMSWIRKKHYIN